MRLLIVVLLGITSFSVVTLRVVGFGGLEDDRGIAFEAFLGLGWDGVSGVHSINKSYFFISRIITRIFFQAVQLNHTSKRRAFIELTFIFTF